MRGCRCRKDIGVISVKKGIEVWPDWDSSGTWRLNIKKKRGTLSLDEIREIAMEYEQDIYALIIKAIDLDMEQYFDDVDAGDYITLYSATDFFRERQKND